MDEDIELSGVVTKIDFVNPHSWVHFEMTGADGTKSAHRCELPLRDDAAPARAGRPRCSLPARA